MATIATTTKPVYRHRQDTGVSCGRACAQMIISSLSQHGSAPTSTIAVDQETLRTRETNKIDIVDWWFTEPDELRDLLAGAPELSLADRNWRVASHSSSNKLLADLILSMAAHHCPAAVATGPNDHWMTLIEVQLTAGRYAFVFLNPLPSALTVGPPGAFKHKYVDPQCGTNQQPLVVVNQGNEVADLSLTIKGRPIPKTITIVSPAGEQQTGQTLPPLSTVGTYTGKATGVTFGPPQLPAAITALAQVLKTSRLAQFRIMAADPVNVVRSNQRAQFRSLTESFDAKPAEQTLMATDLVIRATRLVEDVLRPQMKFVLSSGYSAEARSGFVAAFDSSILGELLHVQITDDEMLINSVARYHGEPLYWTNEPTSHFPPMAMPYFVFRKKRGQPNTLIRLYDDAEGEVMPAQAGSDG